MCHVFSEFRRGVIDRPARLLPPHPPSAPSPPAKSAGGEGARLESTPKKKERRMRTVRNARSRDVGVAESPHGREWYVVRNVNTPVGPRKSAFKADAVVAYLILGAVVCYLVAGVIQGPRQGALCGDGWESTAVGRGACSHHHGVSQWRHVNDESAEPVWISGHSCLVGAILTFICVQVGHRNRKARLAAVSPLPAPKLQRSSSRNRLSPPRERSSAPRAESSPSRSDGSACPRCGCPLVQRVRKRDGHAFLGCSEFPRCRYTCSVVADGGLS